MHRVDPPCRLIPVGRAVCLNLLLEFIVCVTPSFKPYAVVVDPRIKVIGKVVGAEDDLVASLRGSDGALLTFGIQLQRIP